MNILLQTTEDNFYAYKFLIVLNTNSKNENFDYSEIKYSTLTIKFIYVWTHKEWTLMI